MEENELTQH